MGLEAKLIALCCAVAVVAGSGWYIVHLRHQVAVERLKTEAATDNGVARGLEAKGEVQSAQRVDVVVRQVRAADEATATLSESARTAPDANAPIDPDRLARLRAHDLELCRLAALGGCPASADHAGNSAGALRPVPPAGSSDAG